MALKEILLRGMLIILVACSCASAQEMPFTVNLITPLSTSKNHKGDPIKAQVVSPDDFKGDTISGKVTDLKSGNNPTIDFAFDTLNHSGADIPISATITSIANSKGQLRTDDNGHAVQESSRSGSASSASAFGSSIGGLLGGRKGTAVNTATDVASTLMSIHVSGQGPKLSFSTGTQVVLFVKPRGGPELTSLQPNAVSASGASSNETAVPPASGAPVQAPAASAGQSQPAAGGTSDQPQLSAAKIDFVAGEKTIFYDDFSDMAADEPPPHWKLRGDAVELRKGGNIRELTAAGNTWLWSPQISIPKNFTFQADLTLKGPFRLSIGKAEMGQNGSGEVLFVYLNPSPGSHENKTVQVTVQDQALPSNSTLGDPIVNADLSKPVQFALWVQNGRLRAYVNGDRALDVNQVDLPPMNQLFLHLWEDKDNPIGIRSIRLAESAPDFSTVIASGKYISHGITFDTDSDRLKPESAGVLRMVANGLDKNSNLKLAIRGYTDSTGDANHNLDLSKRRAAAVRLVLVSQFGVDASRLTSDGLGAASPMASNDTPEGRAQNRRVEFVKQ